MQDVQSGVFKLRDEIGADLARRRIANLEIGDADVKWRDGFGPDHAIVVMARLDDRGDETRRADAVGPHLHHDLLAVRPVDHGLHRLGIFGSEVENMADFDAARRKPRLLRNCGEGGCVMHFARRRIAAGPLVDDSLQGGRVVEID
jgi:hypothetical protein